GSFNAQQGPFNGPPMPFNGQQGQFPPQYGNSQEQKFISSSVMLQAVFNITSSKDLADMQIPSAISNVWQE
ncbi:MAG: hypothetical protein EZS28_018643, partial [Streblomastix strix]